MARAKRRTRKWIKKAVHKRGALHRHYRLPLRSKIPLRLLVRDRHKPGKLGQRVRFALGRRGYYRTHRRAYKRGVRR
jgi:hypothetical protein